MLRYLCDTARRIKTDESGATAIEYGLIAALISVALIGGASSLGNEVSNDLIQLGDTIERQKLNTGFVDD